MYEGFKFFFIFQFYGRDDEFEKILKKLKKNGKDVKTISLQNKKQSKEIVPLKIILDCDTDVRATNFHGTTKTGRPYITPQLVFVRATGKHRTLDISFPFNQLEQIIESLTTIRNENDEYFDDV